MPRVEKEFHEAWDVESTKAVADAKVELPNVKEALRVLEGRASGDRSAIRSAVKERDRPQNELAITSAKL